MTVRRLCELFPPGERKGGGTEPVLGDMVMAHIVFLTSATAAALIMMRALVVADLRSGARLHTKTHPEKAVYRSASLC